MGEAPESRGEIEGHREILRGRRSLYVKWSEHAGVVGLSKDDAVAFLAYLIGTGSASTAASRGQVSRNTQEDI
jgi:hypothetical protein